MADFDAIWQRIQNNTFQGFTFRRRLGEGKSAAVFLAESGGNQVAVKMYDPHLLRMYGQEVQTERLRRELSLRGHQCRDLVHILDGGDLRINDDTFPFVALEYVDGIDLRVHINRVGRLPDFEIRKHLGSLVRAAKFLLEQAICHRDIKTDNCRLRKDGHLILLDLGVLKQIGQSDLTDSPGDPASKPFLGTLRYASPEFLRRREGDDAAAWHAVTIYQIGTVLYEMIQGALLFSHIREPYGELVNAVLYETPILHRDDIGRDLISLTRCCLIKDPIERLRLVRLDQLALLRQKWCERNAA